MTFRKGETGNAATTFKKGQSGNPGGRPPGLGTLIRAATKDGAELVAFHLDVMRAANGVVSDRLKAATWLTERGFGRLAEQLEVSGPEGGALRIVIEE